MQKHTSVCFGNGAICWPMSNSTVSLVYSPPSLKLKFPHTTSVRENDSGLMCCVSKIADVVSSPRMHQADMSSFRRG